MSDIYPWQRRQWETWINLAHSDRLPHALLLYGNSGIGIRDFVIHAAHSILCEHAEAAQKPCGRCRACRLLAAGTHPDYCPAEAQKKEIQIDQVLRLIAFLQLERQYRQYRLVVIPEIDKLNYSAANALLKILEEPPPWALILAGTENLSRLPATIRSRFQKMRFPLPGEEAEGWLAEKLGCDRQQARQKLRRYNMQALVALAESASGKEEKDSYESFHADFVAYIQGRVSLTRMAEEWQGVAPERIQNWLLRELHSALKLQFLPDADSEIPFAHIKGKPLENLYLLQVGRCHMAHANLNSRLLLESSLPERGRALARPN